METYLETTVIPQYEKLGVNFSGGTDSSLLLYMLGITHPNTELYVFTGTREYDNMYNITHAKKILELLNLPNLKQHIIATWKDRKHGRSEREYFKFELDKKYNIQAWTNGFTLNPPVDLGPGRDTRRDVIQDIITVSDKVGNKTYRPFVALTKKDIAEKYNQLNLKNSLLPLTISCEAINPPRPCGQCYNCLEKHWGFGEF